MQARAAMMDINKIHKDIDDFCRRYNCRYFFYDKLHVYDEQGLPSQMPAFLAETEQFLGPDYRNLLLDRGVITRFPGGGYDFNFSSNVENGGATCYSAIGEEQGLTKNILIFFDDQTMTERHNIYHEMAHIIQYEHDFYNLNVLQKLYSFSIKEAKYKGGSTLCQKFADAWDYCDYLREAHADAFATACMLLRCENKKEFRRECRRSYIRSGMTFYQASRDPDREYPSLRFYMSFPIEKEIIRQMKRYRRSGEDRQFFLPDGKIDMKKLADAVDEAVMKNAFSPRVFQQILDDDRKGRCGIHEKSWRQPLGEARWCRFLSILDLDGETKALQRKVDAHTRRNEERTAVSFERLKSADSSAVLLNIACGLDDKSISLTEIMRFFKINPNSYAELDVMTALAAGRLPDAAVRTAKAKILKQKPHCGAFMAEMLEKYQKGVNKLLGVAEIPSATAGVLRLMQKNPVVRERIWEMYRQRRQDPQAAVCPEKFVLEQPLTSRRQRRRLEENYRLALHRLGRRIGLEDKSRYAGMLDAAVAAFAAGTECREDPVLKPVADDLYVMYYRCPEAFKRAVAGFKNKSGPVVRTTATRRAGVQRRNDGR